MRPVIGSSSTAVHDVLGATLSGMAGIKGKTEELQGLEFQKLLQEAQSNRKQSEGTTSPEAPVGKPEFFPDPVLSIPSVNLATHAAEPSALRSQGIGATEKTLELLEQYQRALADPKISLKEANPLVQSLSREMKDLAGWAGKLSSSDPLQKILTDLGILASVEVEKFNRGDYI